jgi:large subunit ribosomal protein L10
MNKRTIKPQKVSRVSVLRGLISQAKSIAVVDYTKMTPPQATQLRKQVLSAGGEVKVEKNTLFKIASGIPLELHGLSAFVFSKTDEIAALKVVSDFIKKNNVLSFKMGLLGDKVLTAEETIRLSQTPSATTSISKLLYLVNYNTFRLVRTLEAIRQKTS